MKVNKAGDSHKRYGYRFLHLTIAIMVVLVPFTIYGYLNLHDAPQGLPDIDNRAGKIEPTGAQLAMVQNMGATAEWNQFGTIKALIKYGGYISTGYNGEAVSAARSWVRDNRDLFRLSAAGVDNLVLVSDGRMPYNDAHFVLFRQKFGDFVPTQDGQINVSIINGNVFHVWSSSAGDLKAPEAPTLTPAQGWLAAAANIGHTLSPSRILAVKNDTKRGWNMITVAGFAQAQQVRLTALPTTTEVRPAYEANVVNVSGEITEAYTVFVDAKSGEILTRTNRVNWLAEPVSAPMASPPDTQTFSGTFDGSATAPFHSYPCLTPKNSFTVPSGKVRIVVHASAGLPTNDISVTLEGPSGSAVAGPEDTGTSSEVLTYEPSGGVPPGIYQVQICQTPTPQGVPQMPPYNYAGTFTTDDSPVPGADLPSPQWQYHFANPMLDYSSTDVRHRGCWNLDLVPIPGCEREEQNIASRGPWDYDFRANNYTNTTRGNNAQTAESWGSPLTPSTPYAPVPTDSRQYIFPWKNEWKTRVGVGMTTKTPPYGGCDPTILTHSNPNSANPAGNTDADIDASTVHLFVTHNRFHDFSYFLGFTEQNSNMQADNFGNTQPGREADPEFGNVQAGAVSGGYPSFLGRDNANQVTLQDGTPGITNQYLFQPLLGALYSPCVDGAMDVGIVGHEYTHAISNRMVDGPDGSLSDGSMGESWSDQDAAEYLWENGYVPTADEDPTAVGIYATQNKKLAIRNFSLAVNPLTFGNVGYDTGGPEVHSDGEVWNAVNWQVRQALIDKYNSAYPYTDMTRQKACAMGRYNPENCPGNRRWIQLVYDAFLLQGATNMLLARDAMLAADVARFGGANQAEIWRAFAKRGFGADAIITGGGDIGVPSFDSMVETNEATVTFQAVASDEGNAPITNAKIIVGQFQARTRHIADTDPATVVDMTSETTRKSTQNNSDTAKFVPGSYDLIVQAPGYGIQRFTRTFVAGQTATVTFSLPTNRASTTKTATSSVGGTAFIDDTEDTGAVIDSVAPVAGDKITVDLQGTAPVNVTSVNVSTTAGPGYGGRFTGVRKFEILTCDATNIATLGCLLDANFASVFISADDAFPGDVPRPLQPQLNLRSFAVTPSLATHVRLKVLTNQCTGQTKFHGDQDDDPNLNADCLNSLVADPVTGLGGQASVVRATELQVFGNVASIVQPSALEGDVFPRANGDGSVDSLDVGQIRRFQLGLDQPYQSNEFQRADIFDYASRGDACVDSNDVSQAYRYQLLLDPLQAVGGPTVPICGGAIANGSAAPAESKAEAAPRQRGRAARMTPSKPPAVSDAAREVKVVNQTVAPGTNITVALNTDAAGDESIYGFTLNYDTAVLTYVPGSVAIGSGATRQAGGSCNVLENANTAGKIGFSIDCNNSTITAGNGRQLVTMHFNVAPGASNGISPLTFSDAPVVRRVSSNPAAGPIQNMPTTFTDGAVTISANRVVSVVSMNGARGSTITLQLKATTQGDESVYGFSLNYDSSRMAYVPGSAAIGTGATRQAGGSCGVLANGNTAGQIGFSIDCNNSTITAGTDRQLVTMQFSIAGNTPSGQTPVTFGDTPAGRAVSSNPANGPIVPLTTTFVDGSVNVQIPTAAEVSVAGRVMTEDGSGIRGARVYLTDESGKTLEVLTNSFGYYRFDGVASGQTYVAGVKQRGYSFASRTITVTDDISDADFMANPR